MLIVVLLQHCLVPGPEEVGDLTRLALNFRVDYISIYFILIALEHALAANCLYMNYTLRMDFPLYFGISLVGHGFRHSEL